MGIPAAAIYLAEDSPERAIELLAPVAERSDESLIPPGSHHALLFDAAPEGDVGRCEAEAVLERALDLAEPEGLILPLTIIPSRAFWSAIRGVGTAHATFLSTILDVRRIRSGRTCATSTQSSASTAEPRRPPAPERARAPRSHDLSGWAKAGWIVLIVLLPLLGVLIYVIARGDKMKAHEVSSERLQARAFIGDVEDLVFDSMRGARLHRHRARSGSRVGGSVLASEHERSSCRTAWTSSLGLAPGRSLVEYLVGQGQQVFTLSWRNPGQTEGHFDLDTPAQAVAEARDAVASITTMPTVHLAAACSGGIITAGLVGSLAATNDLGGIASLTLLVCALDSATEGTFSALTTHDMAAAAVAESARRGYVDGQALAGVFTWLRPNDLVWNYVENNYLLGKAPPAFDILYWNQDAVRLAAGLHRDLIHVALENSFARPGQLEVLGHPVDLGQVDLDAYCVAAAICVR